MFTSVVPAGSPEVVVPQTGITIQSCSFASLSSEKSRAALRISYDQAGPLTPGICMNRKLSKSVTLEYILET